LSVGRPKKTKFAVAITINDDSLELTLEFLNMMRCENQQPGPSAVTISIWAAKAKGIGKLSKVQLEDMQQHASKCVINENEDQRQQWL